MKKWILRGVFGCLVSIMFLFCLTACIAGADYEDRWINTYRSKGPRVFDDFQVTRSNQELPQAKIPETPDEILFRIIDTEMKRSGQLIFTNVSNTEIHAFAVKLKEFFPELRITVAHKPFSEWNRVWGKVFKINGKCEFRTVYLDENCCPDEYKKMNKEDFKKLVDAFFAGEYDILLCADSYYNIHRLYGRQSPKGKPPIIEKIPLNMKSSVVDGEWKEINGIWRARSLGNYALEPADQEAVQIIENLYQEK